MKKISLISILAFSLIFYIALQLNDSIAHARDNQTAISGKIDWETDHTTVAFKLTDKQGIPLTNQEVKVQLREIKNGQFAMGELPKEIDYQETALFESSIITDEKGVAAVRVSVSSGYYHVTIIYEGSNNNQLDYAPTQKTFGIQGVDYYDGCINYGNVETDKYFYKVGEPVEVTITPKDNDSCKGLSIQYEYLVEGHFWTDENINPDVIESQTVKFNESQKSAHITLSEISKKDDFKVISVKNLSKEKDEELDNNPYKSIKKMDSHLLIIKYDHGNFLKKESNNSILVYDSWEDIFREINQDEGIFNSYINMYFQFNTIDEEKYKNIDLKICTHEEGKTICENTEKELGNKTFEKNYFPFPYFSFKIPEKYLGKPVEAFLFINGQNAGLESYKFNMPEHIFSGKNIFNFIIVIVIGIIILSLLIFSCVYVFISFDKRKKHNVSVPVSPKQWDFSSSTKEDYLKACFKAVCQGLVGNEIPWSINATQMLFDECVNLSSSKKKLLKAFCTLIYQNYSKKNISDDTLEQVHKLMKKIL